MNNRAIVKWWAYFEEVEKQFLMLEQLDKQAEGDSLDISDEKLYLERRTGQENFQKLQKSAKELYIDIVANFKLCLQSLEDLSSSFIIPLSYFIFNLYYLFFNIKSTKP